MWQKSQDDSRAIWMDITARERNFAISLFGQGSGVFAKESQVLEEETYQNLREALNELTDQQRTPEPEAFSNFGSLLFELALPEKIQVELLKHEGPLVFSTHELLLPWELLCANDQFLCLKHAVSRQLPVLSRMSDELLGHQRNCDVVSDEDAVLIIANPTGELRCAEDEAEELRAIFKQANLRCDTLIGPKECTYQNVLAARLRKHAYRIIHFSGHAHYLEQKGTSAILLADGRMIMAQEIQRTFKGEPLVFLNACWSAMGEVGQSQSGRAGHSGSSIVRTLTEAFTFGNRSGRARAIIGSMWWIADDVARGLAGCFYQEMLAGHQLGEALRRARHRVSGTVSDPALWSTYVLFGDPNQSISQGTLLPVATINESTVNLTNTESFRSTPSQSASESIPFTPPPQSSAETTIPPVTTPAAPAEPSASDDELPWSDEMRAAFVGAMAAMSTMHWKVFSTVHLVLGLTYVENGLVAQALTRRGINPHTARRTLRELFTIQETDHSIEDSIISDNVKATLNAAQAAARSSGAAEVTEDHVLTALLDRPESGGTMLLSALQVDLDDLRHRIQPSTSEIRSVPQPALNVPQANLDLMLPDGELDRTWFDDTSRLALEEATLMAYRSYWADLRSPHIFLGILNRRGSRLAEHLLSLRLIDPNSLASSFLASLTDHVDASLRQPKLHREFLSENALLTLRKARDIAQQRGDKLISEHDILAAILGNESNVITSSLSKAGVEPHRLLWQSSSQ